MLILDVMMPGMSGFELAKRVKSEAATSHLPIIFLTAKDTEDDTLQGFGLGADDYVTKPFSVREVVARVKAVLRRPTPNPSPREGSLISYEGLVLNLGKKTTAWASLKNICPASSNVSTASTRVAVAALAAQVLVWLS